MAERWIKGKTDLTYQEAVDNAITSNPEYRRLWIESVDDDEMFRAAVRIQSRRYLAQLRRPRYPTS